MLRVSSALENADSATVRAPRLDSADLSPVEKCSLVNTPQDPPGLDEAIFRTGESAPGARPAAASADSPKPPSARPSRLRRLPLWLRILAVPIALALIVAGFYVVRTMIAAGSVQREDGLVFGYDGRPAAGLGQNFLVLSRSTTNRTDVVLLVHLNQARNKLFLVSLPRNLAVSVDGKETQLQNLSGEGAGALTKAVEQLAGARIEHVAKVDLQGFIGLTESLGGVVVNNPYASTTRSGLKFEKGEITVRGETALAFVGDDSPIPNRDTVLAERQRSVLRAVVLKVLRPEVLANPATFDAVVGDLTRNVTVDSGMTAGVMWDLATSIRLGGSADVVAAQAPIAGVSSTSTGDTIMLPDQAKAAELGAALRGDTMNEYQARYPA